MKRLASGAGLASFITVVTGLVMFVAADTPYSQSSLALIAIGYLASSIVALVGWLLVRAPWGRWSLVTATAAGMLLASTAGSAGLFIVYAVGGGAIIAISGPWLTLWVRQHPPPGRPNPVALTLITVAPLSPLVVGLAAYDSSHWSHWVAALTGVMSSWAYGRGIPLAVWSLRIAVPTTSLAAIITAPMPTALVLGFGAAFVTILAWLPAATATTTFPNPPLPAPRPQRRETSDASD